MTEWIMNECRTGIFVYVEVLSGVFQTERALKHTIGSLDTVIVYRNDTNGRMIWIF